MRKILIIIAGFNFGVSGGVASTLYNYTIHMDPEEFSFDYLALGYQGFEPYREELEARGGKLYCLNVTSHGWNRFQDSVKGIKRFLKEHPEYDIVHCNSGAIRQVLMMVLASHWGGSRRIIAHAHSAMRLSKKEKIVYGVVSNLFLPYVGSYLACSKMAAESMFPKKIIKEGRWTYLPNGIEPERFVYIESTRVKIRHELGIAEDCFVLGHVGRINAAKNHKFLIDVFAEVQKRLPNSKLVIVGAGDLQDAVTAKAKDLGILNLVIFTGQRRDVNRVLQAMDVFVFPSLYEGLGMSVIEAQATGLPVIASDCLPEETHVTNLIKYLPLGDAALWADAIVGHKGYMDRVDHIQKIKEAGYDIWDDMEILRSIYRNINV